MEALSDIVILAGGQSRRMGQNKAFLQFLGKSQIQRLMDDAQSIPLNIWLAGGCVDYSSIRHQGNFCEDYLEGTQGPLSAMQTALECVNKLGRSWLLVYATDTMICPSEMLVYLNPILDTVDEKVDMILPKAQKTLPLSGLYRTRLYQDLKAYLNQGERRVMKFIEQYHSVEVQLPESLHLCANFNTQAEFVEGQKYYLRYQEQKTKKDERWL